MAQIICENLTLGYDDKTILSGLNLSIEKGDYLCIVGDNGSGKTTFMKTLLGLLTPVSGKIITCDGLESVQIGYLPQQTQIQRDFPASVYEIVLSGCLNKARGLFYSKDLRQRAYDNMRKVAIGELAKKSYRQLSGGQQQRVLLARTLCAADKMLLLDEPASGLDPAAAQEMYSVISSLNKDSMTIIMITHDMAAVKKYATHVLHIGSDVFFGEKAEYISKYGKQGEGL